MQQKISMAGRTLAIVIACSTLAMVAAAQPKAAGRFRDWAVYTETRDGDTICFAATEASSKAPANARHGDVWLYVTSWKSGAARNQPSIKTGFDFKPDGALKTTIGRSSWSMFAAGREAFAEDSDDPRIVSALREGSSARFDGVSARGTNVTYRFSLRGSADAIDKAADLCK